MDDPRIALLLRQLALAFEKRSWHGPNLLGSLRGVNLETASWRPQRERHNIWEIVVHCAYWKYRVCRILSPDATPSFSLKGSDWFRRPVEVHLRLWKQDLEILQDWHGRLEEAVRQVDPHQLEENSGTGQFTFSEVVSGAAAHDVYHAGQIRLLRRMHSNASNNLKEN